MPARRGQHDLLGDPQQEAARAPAAIPRGSSGVPEPVRSGARKGVSARSARTARTAAGDRGGRDAACTVTSRSAGETGGAVAVLEPELPVGQRLDQGPVVQAERARSASRQARMANGSRLACAVMDWASRRAKDGPTAPGRRVSPWRTGVTLAGTLDRGQCAAV